MATLDLSGVQKAFGATRVLHGVDLAVADGEMIVIVGASGCGKSTLLRIVAGLETPTAGSVRIGGRDVTALEPADRDIAMVFQNYALYPHMSVAQNMGYGLKIRGLPRPEIDRRVRDAAALLGIEALLDRRPRQLSGGQRQRVAMGRAIVREPKLFLFDEPLSNLDAKLRVQMRAEIRRLQKRLGVTSLFVTHDQIEAMTLGDRLVVMHQGHAAQVATPMEIFERPADTYVAGFIGSPAMNFLEGVLAGGGRAVALRAGPTIPFADGPRPGPDGLPLTIGLRPEHLRLEAGGLPLAIDLAEPLGSETVLHGRLPDGEALVIRLAGPAPRDGTLPVTLPAEHLHVFVAEGGRRLDPAPA
ncbi:sn-glycerol-3-phosphate ABC transporter ATP-binding protein UgpC [Paracraurococcus ruber]|uniref:Sn-glycerol-3-phosphate ABC transporter ATP-binding protein UgpC n=1 Tax=Paracraurococcus ruber TaxID=77675 RepID=A0ABS1D0A3_9PROT|nr:sn-glycerol-3-phosphate ABC transporter ATP-binding protein UgpC [Paracraurococcus ruber]MBK1660233.1 sn-glycerol-3-phosphate ABC transporter ATP-binding protein UgpC [Paracraurococcus ruber]TDG32293.1 sn-glycerol-3-phosphate ABC transporter ATP-binding protein UgpC [Paracraurococcus ruber]